MEHKREIPQCEVCQKPANQTCGGCKLVYYCSRAHQKLGWREGHKFKCCAFKVQYSDTIGRHMVATRDIQPGEMILKEKPALIGPKMSSPAHCLACGRKLEPMKIGDKLDFYKCSSCLWPMCNQKCEKAKVHKAECKIMTEKKYKCTIKYEQPDKSEAAYCVIAPMRVLLMKQSNPQQFENIINLESHLDERIDLSDNLLQRKIDLCHELLEIADKIEPGWTRFRGTLLLDLQSAMTIQTKREFETEKLTKAAAQDRLMECMVLLQEAANILRVEPHMKDALEAKIQELASQLEVTDTENGSECLSVD
ncbi:uncharacterized protein LOC133526315 isoform X2 [Cydia pomonella]|uniref:uncharacterized protein LOC133526315 isoform X2 n=1 Tax=Cydia pomonella TaxID=82600 RepID=UPI002ADD78A6|nr:uncharacterized protein LOC133526315 isoform X2 [Cydia pomonella]